MYCKIFVGDCKSTVKYDLMAVLLVFVIKFNDSTFCLKTATMIL